MTTNIIINGACGRMGRQIALAASSDSAVTISGCLDLSSNPESGQDIGILSGFGATGILVSGNLQSLPIATSVIIDFSSPESTMALASRLKGTGARLVVGTTGLTSEQTAQLAQMASTLPMVVSPNMSVGVNLLFHLTRLVTQRLGQTFDIEIVEAHHHHKKDSPSGTARRLGEVAAEALGKTYDEAIVHGRNGMVGARPRGEIGMHAVRGGDIVGDHTVLFAGDGERIELKHVAHSRATFAQGAVFAAKWLAEKGPGLYSMSDVLNI